MPTISRNIRQLPDGRYRVRFKLGKKERTKICATEKEAKDYIIDAKKGIFAAGQRFLTLTEKEQIRLMVLLEEASADKGYGHGITVFETAMKFYEENAPKDGIPLGFRSRRATHLGLEDGGIESQIYFQRRWSFAPLW